MSRTSIADKTAPRHATAHNATQVHVQRKKPQKISTNGLHSIHDSAANFGRITVKVTSAQSATASKKKMPVISNSTMLDLYDGAQLGAHTTRAGAMDAFTKPSRVGKTLFYRDGHTETLP